MSNKQAHNPPKITIQGRVNAELYPEYLKWGESQGIKQKTLILEPILRIFFSEHPTSKPLEQTPSEVSIPQVLSCDCGGLLKQTHIDDVGTVWFKCDACGRTKSITETEWNRQKILQGVQGITENPQTNKIEDLEQKPCSYKTLIKTKRALEVLCAEKHKIPLEACQNRQKRYQLLNQDCIPIGMETPKPLHEQIQEQSLTEKEETLEEERFPCDKLCKRFRSCTRNAVFSKGEIKAQHCYISKFPYEWTTPDGRDVRLCKFMVFESTQPYGDPDHPYPQCIAQQKDVPLQLPRDRIMRNPEICWSCYMMRKKAREEQFNKQQVKKYIKQDYQRRGDGIDARSLSYDLGDGY